MTATRRYAALAVVLLLLLLAGGWFLLVSPKRSEAAGLRADTVTQEQANDRLRSRIRQLEAQAKDLATQRARLAQLTARIPEEPQLPAFLRDLTDAAAASGVDLRSVAPQTPTPLTPPTPQSAPAPAPEGAPAGTPPVTPPSGAPAAADAGPSVYVVPVKIQVAGSYAAAEAFLNKLEELQRSFLTTGIVVAADEGSGSEEAANGDVLLTVEARVFTRTPLVAGSSRPTATPSSSAPASGPVPSAPADQAQ